ncbi:MAG: mannitol dehydrogenase family protein [Burkholderiaceae bacterium]|nr:mannitol dehydrogenase family protein [Burkholderiaceae bacterium]
MAQSFLNQTTLASLVATGARLPSYPRKGLVPGVVHLGLGAFHRAHQAMVFETLLQRGDPRWGVLGVAMRSTQVAETLDAQDGLYSVQVASAQDTYWQVVGSIWQTCVASREPEQVVAVIAAPLTRWVTLTVTEKGYTAELATLIVRGLAARRMAGLSGLTIASCDNLSGNGDLLKALCVRAAGDAALQHWIVSQCAFPNSMVDRIVPAATALRREEAAQALRLTDDAALATEGFWEWVLEDHFADAADADTLRSVGVTVVSAVKPFEEAKLRMLNGSHSAMACMGAVLGLPTICDCITQPDIRQFVHNLMTLEIMPHLSRPDLATYRDALLARFANPALKHSVHQIATDNSQKIPQRWPPSALAQLDSGGSAEHLAFAAAVWMRYCLGEDERGGSYALSDPLAEVLQATAKQHRGDAPATVKALLGTGSIWGNLLPQDVRWTPRVTYWLGQIQSCGVMQALKDINRGVNRNARPG